MRSSLNRLLSLTVLVVVAWISIVFGLFIVFRVIFEVTLPWQNALAPLVVGVSRVMLSALIAVAWLVTCWKLANLYLWRRLRRGD